VISMPRGDEVGLRPENSVIPCFREKLREEPLSRPYRKPTQVGGVSIPRRVRERWLRNSANLHRNFRRRCALHGEARTRGALGGCRETEVAELTVVMVEPIAQAAGLVAGILVVATKVNATIYVWGIAYRHSSDPSP